MRQLVGARIELAIAEASAPRTPPRPHRASWRPGRRTAPAGWRAGPDARCRSTPAGWCRAPRRRECRGCRSPAPAPRPPPPAAEPAAPPAPRRSPGRTGRWRIRARRRSPPACRPRARCSARLSDRSNLALAVSTGSNGCRQPRQLEAGRRVVLQRQHHLEQRMPRQRARRVEHLHQPLERQVLVAVGRQIGRAHPRDQLARSSDCRTCRCAAPGC